MTGINFLIDSGAGVSIIPPSLIPANSPRNHKPVSFKIIAVNNSVIHTHGRVSLLLHFPGMKPIRWSFIVADIAEPLVGCDLLRAHGLLLDFSRCTLRHGKSPVTISSTPVVPPTPTKHHPQAVRACTSSYPKIFDEHDGETLVKSSFTIQHCITTNSAQPLYCKPRRLSPEKLLAAKAQVKEMVKTGVWRPSNSPWSSPLNLVQKSNGSWRPCGDFRRLNIITQKDEYPLPNINDFVAELNGAQFFSKLDLCKGFWQVPLRQEDIPKTAVTTPFGLFEHLRLPFGIKNAPQTFQRFMDRLLVGLDGVFVYVDDILIASKTEKRHMEILRDVSLRLKKANIRLSREKCVFMQPSITFLGYLLTHNGTTPPPDRASAFTKMPPPTTRKLLMRFLGAINYYRRFLKGYAAIVQPLYAESAKLPANKCIVWDKPLSSAFTAAKNAMSSAALLFHPIPGAPTCITTDASDVGIGGVLEQHDGSSWRPLAFFSRALSATQVKYSTYDRELLAIFESIKHFLYFVDGRSFAIVTDHEPLVSAFKSPNTSPIARRQRQLEFISEFTSVIHHVPGKDNIIADLLSRAIVISAATIHSAGISVPWLIEEQNKCALTQALPNDSRYVKISSPDGDIICFGSPPRPFVPPSCREKIILTIHNQAHSGYKATRSLIGASYIWPHMSSDIKRVVKLCQACQASKVVRYNKPPFQAFPLPNARFQAVHLDFVGPLPPSKSGKQYLLTIIDRYTRYPVVIPVSGPTSQSLIKNFELHWLSHFGAPQFAVSDRGAAFTSAAWREMLDRWSIKQKLTSACHPQANGMIERLHKTLKSAIMAREERSWEDSLPPVLLALRNSVKEDLQVTPSQLVYADNMVIPGQIHVTDSPPVSPATLAHALSDVTFPLPSHVRWHIKKNVITHQMSFTESDYVLVKSAGPKPPLTRPYEGPFRIINPKNNRCGLTLNLMIRGTIRSVSVSRLKPAFLYDPVEVDESWNEMNELLPETHPSPPPLMTVPLPPRSPVQTRSRTRHALT